MEEQTYVRLEEFKNLETRVAKLEASFETAPPKTAKPQSIREFVLGKRPKTDVVKTAVIGYYIEIIEGRGSFNLKDIKEGFRSAKEIIPGNPSEAVRQNGKHGYFTESKKAPKEKGTKRWEMTNAGISFVEGLKKP